MIELPDDERFSTITTAQLLKSLIISRVFVFCVVVHGVSLLVLLSGSQSVALCFAVFD